MMARPNIKAMAVMAIAVMFGLIAISMLTGSSRQSSMLLEKDGTLSKAAGLRHKLSASVQKQHLLGSQVKALVAASQMRATRTQSLDEEDNAALVDQLEVRIPSSKFEVRRSDACSSQCETSSRMLCCYMQC